MRWHDGCGWLDDLVDDADLDRPVHPAGDAFVLDGELGLDLRADVGGDLGQPASVEDPVRGDLSRDGDLGTGPGEDLGGAEERAFIAM